MAITTLMFERAGLGAAAVMGLCRSLDELIELIRERGLDEDPMIRQTVSPSSRSGSRRFASARCGP